MAHANLAANSYQIANAAIHKKHAMNVSNIIPSVIAKHALFNAQSPTVFPVT